MTIITYLWNGSVVENRDLGHEISYFCVQYEISIFFSFHLVKSGSIKITQQGKYAPNTQQVYFWFSSLLRILSCYDENTQQRSFWGVRLNVSSHLSQWFFSWNQNKMCTVWKWYENTQQRTSWGVRLNLSSHLSHWRFFFREIRKKCVHNVEMGWKYASKDILGGKIESFSTLVMLMIFFVKS